MHLFCCGILHVFYQDCVSHVVWWKPLIIYLLIALFTRVSGIMFFWIGWDYLASDFPDWSRMMRQITNIIRLATD
jgi:hypothetical protein